jgi:tetratricopeptide (TPR) repeat protein
VLVVLDDAASAAQVRPLLPGTAGSLVLITCRNSLTDLDAVETLSLTVMPAADAVGLLGRVAGPDRTNADPHAAAEVARLCAHLPLAVRIAAARLRSRPAWTVADLARRLGGEQHRLAELSVGDRSVTGAFMLSYQHLTDSQRRVFRLLGLHPGTDLDLAAAVALTGEPVLVTERDLDALVDAHMVQQPAGGRYRMHDLLRELARDLARRDPGRDEAVGRLLDHYEAWLADAAATLDPRRDTSDRFSDYDDALAWCEAEQDNLVAMTVHASRHGWTRHARRIPDLLWLFLRTLGRHQESVELHRLALSASADPDETRATLLRNQANSHASLGRYADARDELRQALDICRQIGDRGGEGAVLGALGVIAERTGDYETARDHYDRALPLRRSAGDRWGEASNLLYLGLVLDRLGRHTEALDRYAESLTLRREMNDVRGEGATLTCAGMTYDRLGRYDEALSHHRRALELMRQAKDRQGEAAALGNIANVLRHLGRAGEALDHHHECLDILREVGDRNSESDVLNDVGETYLAIGRLAEAVSSHRSALAIAEQVQARREQARAHDGIARCLRDDDPDRAAEHWRLALDLYHRIGAPEADEVTKELAGLPR